MPAGDQLRLPFAESAPPKLVCAFGSDGADWPGPHHCAACAALVTEMVARFEAAVARGEYDREGYKANERR